VWTNARAGTLPKAMYASFAIKLGVILNFRGGGISIELPSHTHPDFDKNEMMESVEKSFY
jgi:hypothetical protein